MKSMIMESEAVFTLFTLVKQEVIKILKFIDSIELGNIMFMNSFIRSISTLVSLLR